MFTDLFARRRRQKHHRDIYVSLAVVAAAALVLSGCSAAGASSSSSAGNGAGVYSLGLAAPDGNIDPLTTADYNAMFIVGLASAGLIIQSPSGKLQPQLATSWKPSDDKLSWTIGLRDGAEFSDGSAITAKDVVATFESILAPKSQSPAKSSFTGIVKAVSASTDGKSVVFTLERPYSDFPYLLTGANTSILPSGVKDTDWIKHPIGAGQFVLDKYTAGQGVTYVKNPHYWDAAHVKLSGVDVKFYSDAQSQLLAFQSGEIDQIASSPSVTAALGTGYRHVREGYQKFDGIVLNVTKTPFDDPTVRQALAWALDRKAIVKTVYGGDATVGNDVATFPDYGVQPKGVDARAADKAKVKQLLAGRTISFTITTYESEKTLATVVQQQLQAVGGFDVTLKVLTEAQYYADGSDTPWLNAPVTITDWADRLPSQLVSLLYAKNSDWNASHYANPQLEQLASQYDATTDPDEQQKLADQIATIEWTDVPVIVPAFVENDLVIGKKVEGTFENGQNFSGGFDFRGIQVSGE